MTDQQPNLDTIQTLDLLALMDDRAAATVSGHLAALVTEVRRLRAQPSAIEQVEQAFAAELNDDRALTLLDALIVLRSKLPCTCARSQGLHETGCRRYVPGHDLLSPARRLARAREALCLAAVESHVVADDSDDPEHVDDCPGCEAFTLTGHRTAPAARSAAV